MMVNGNAWLTVYRMPVVAGSQRLDRRPPTLSVRLPRPGALSGGNLNRLSDRYEAGRIFT